MPHSGSPSNASQHPQTQRLGSYRHDVAYTAALKSIQALPLGSYRHDVAYTAALKSAQTHPLGSYRHDVAYTAALKSGSVASLDSQGVLGILHSSYTALITGVAHGVAPVIFLWSKSSQWGQAT